MEGMYYVRTVDGVDYFVKGELIAIPNKRQNMVEECFAILTVQFLTKG